MSKRYLEYRYLKHVNQLLFLEHVVVKEVVEILVKAVEDFPENGRLAICVFQSYIVIVISQTLNAPSMEVSRWSLLIVSSITANAQL